VGPGRTADPSAAARDDKGKGGASMDSDCETDADQNAAPPLSSRAQPRDLQCAPAPTQLSLILTQTVKPSSMVALCGTADSGSRALRTKRFSATCKARSCSSFKPEKRHSASSGVFCVSDGAARYGSRPILARSSAVVSRSPSLAGGFLAQAVIDVLRIRSPLTVFMSEAEA
jgi:hypothetical protein